MKFQLSVSGMAAFSLVIGLATAASAAPITVTDIEMPLNDILTVHVPGGYQGGAYVGQFLLTTSTGSVIPAWCIDLYHDTSLGAGQHVTYNFGAISTDSNGTALTNTQISEISGLVNYGDALLSTAAGATNDNSAAIQLAIWKIEVPTFTWSGGPVAEVATLIADASTFGGLALAMTVAGNGQLSPARIVPVSMSITRSHRMFPSPRASSCSAWLSPVSASRGVGESRDNGRHSGAARHASRSREPRGAR